jgi:hypothetical protein
MNDRFADLETVVVASKPLPEMGINAQIWRPTRAVCLGKFPASPRKIVEQLTGPERDARGACAGPLRRGERTCARIGLVRENRPSSRVVSGGIGRAVTAASHAARGTRKIRPAARTPENLGAHLANRSWF